MQVIRVALAGQPNVGKSMLINSIGNVDLKVGNFSGVTVEKKEVSFVRDGYKFIITDLPGAYSLTEFTQEERVTKNFLETSSYDVVLNVLDSTNLQRNLFLTSEILILNPKIVIALNMSDEAENEGVKIDDKQLSTIIGKRVVKTSALKKEGIDELFTALVSEFEGEKTPSKIRFSDPIEHEISHIENFLKKYMYESIISHRFTAINLLKGEEKELSNFQNYPYKGELFEVLKKSHKHISIHYDTYELTDIFNENIIAFARGAATETVVINKRVEKSFTEKVDAILIHKFFGLPIFLFLMWLLFQLTFTLGALPMDLLTQFFDIIINGTKDFLGNGLLAEIVGDGALSGVAAVVLFLPNIVILFTGISLLESTGYMSRVAFLLDGFFHKFGLHGKSFIPLVTGFGCTVPAYMAARTLKNEKERLITLFVLGFISCSARLPIYVLFIGTFFVGANAGNVLFLIYIAGAIFALIAAKVLKNTAFKGEDEPFVMEMPKYRIPTVKLLFHSVMWQAKSYLKKAGTFIMAASVLVWFASNYPKPKDETVSSSVALEQSYLGLTGKFIEPFFAPLGFDWKMGVALETGLAAKEVVVSTLQILYIGSSKDTNDNDSQLMVSLRNNISTPAAVSFIVFIMLYLPCFAASGVFAREAGGNKYLVYLFLFTTSVAWVFSFIAYNISKVIIN